MEFLLNETIIKPAAKLFPTLVELLVLLKVIIFKRILKDLHWYGLQNTFDYFYLVLNLMF